MAYSLTHPPPDQAGEGLDRDEKTRFGRDPFQTVRTEAAGGDQEVDVRMIVQPPGPGVQDSQQGRRGAQMLRVPTKRQDGLSGHLDEKTIQSLLPAAEKFSKTLRDRGGDMEMVTGQHFHFTGLKPGLGLGGVAGGATAIPTAVKHEYILVAIITVPKMTAQSRRAAGCDVLDGPAMRGQDC